MRARDFTALLLVSAFVPAQAPLPEDFERLAEANCVFWGRNRAGFLRAAIQAQGGRLKESTVAANTRQVMAAIPTAEAGPRTAGATGPVDEPVFAAFAAAGAKPAALTNDYEFCRRVSLDLTGRVPTPERLNQFVFDTSPDKRAKFVEELLAKPEWLDKWTLYFGDHLKNNSINTQIRRYPEGVTAFNKFIRGSLQANKPYDVMVRELLTASGPNSWEKGELNFLVGGVVTGGPLQDIWDQQAANAVKTFLGISHLDCLLCHNGRGHLDALSLWGMQTTRYQAWGMASYFSRTTSTKTQVTSGQPLPYYWQVEDNPRLRVDYSLNTSGGNRPNRTAVGSQPANVLPNYIFTDEGPQPGESHRVAFARQLTADPQFARATVNYLWAYFFGKGIVDPPDQFDPLRLDPANPPPSPWTLQPSNPALLHGLAQEFIKNKYDLKWLMRTIVNSQTYQLSARYDGEWNPAWEKLFARKFVRRLWAEEIHDNVVQTTGILASYPTVNYGPLSWAMQFPEPIGLPGLRNANVTLFLDSFLRGNRDDEERGDDGSIAQALNLMNDSFIMSRVQSNGAATSLLVRALALPNDQMVDRLFLTVLSRNPTAAEKQAALANLSNPSTRNAEAENLLWALFNKVDFIFNY